MFTSTLAALVTVLSAFAAANGAVVQRQASFTFLTPQPTLGGTATTSSAATTSSNTASSNSTVGPTSTPSVTASLPVTPSSTLSVPVTLPTTSGSVTIPVSPSRTITASITASVLPTPGGGAVSCDGAQQWQAAFAYTAGAQAIYNGQLYTAKQWTYNNAPPAHPDQWTLAGTCSQPISNKANCSGISTWQNNVAYTSGNKVTYKGTLWSAVQWTYANSPGDASGSWQNLGVCA